MSCLQILSEDLMVSASCGSSRGGGGRRVSEEWKSARVTNSVLAIHWELSLLRWGGTAPGRLVYPRLLAFTRSHRRCTSRCVWFLFWQGTMPISLPSFSLQLFQIKVQYIVHTKRNTTRSYAAKRMTVFPPNPRLLSYPCCTYNT